MAPWTGLGWAAWTGLRRAPAGRQTSVNRMCVCVRVCAVGWLHSRHVLIDLHYWIQCGPAMGACERGGVGNRGDKTILYTPSAVQALREAKAGQGLTSSLDNTLTSALSTRDPTLDGCKSYVSAPSGGGAGRAPSRMWQRRAPRGGSRRGGRGTSTAARAAGGLAQPRRAGAGHPAGRAARAAPLAPPN